MLLAVGGFVGLKAASGGGSKSATAAAEGGPPGTPGRGGTVGTLQSVDGSTLTVATFNGGTTTVITSASTKFMKAVTGALSDVKAGDRVRARIEGVGTLGATVTQGERRVRI